MTSQGIDLSQASPLGLPDISASATFSPGAYDDVIKQLKAALVEIGNKIDEFVKALRSFATGLLAKIYTAAAAKINNIANRIVQLKDDVAAKINEVLLGITAPLAMFDDSLHWQQIRLLALQLSAATEPVVIDPELRHTGEAFSSAWKSRTAQLYYDAIPAQSSAAFRISALAGEASSTLVTCASAGLAFYTSLLHLLITGVKILISAIKVIAALFNPATAMTVALAEAEKIVAQMSNLLNNVIDTTSNFVQLVGLQATTVAGLKAVVTANNNLPPSSGYGNQLNVDLLVGKWPDPTAEVEWPVHDGKIQTR
jgi:hypothetical protein